MYSVRNKSKNKCSFRQNIETLSKFCDDKYRHYKRRNTYMKTMVSNPAPVLANVIYLGRLCELLTKTKDQPCVDTYTQLCKCLASNFSLKQQMGFIKNRVGWFCTMMRQHRFLIEELLTQLGLRIHVEPVAVKIIVTEYNRLTLQKDKFCKQLQKDLNCSEYTSLKNIVDACCSETISTAAASQIYTVDDGAYDQTVGQGDAYMYQAVKYFVKKYRKNLEEKVLLEKNHDALEELIIDICCDIMAGNKLVSGCVRSYSHPYVVPDGIRNLIHQYRYG